MPRYDFKCKICNNIEEHYISFQDYDTFEATCPRCNGPIERDFSDISIVNFSIPKTLGSLADKHSDKFSEDYKQHLHSKTRKKNGRKNKN